MIDVASEAVFPLREAPDHVPKRNGKKVHISTVIRWKDRGIAGVKLETILIGGVRYTADSALSRFFRVATASRDAQRKDGPVMMPTDDEIEEAEAKLDAAGIRMDSGELR